MPVPDEGGGDDLVTTPADLLRVDLRDEPPLEPRVAREQRAEGVLADLTVDLEALVFLVGAHGRVGGRIELRPDFSGRKLEVAEASQPRFNARTSRPREPSSI